MLRISLANPAGANVTRGTDEGGREFVHLAVRDPEGTVVELTFLAEDWDSIVAMASGQRNVAVVTDLNVIRKLKDE